LIALGAPPAALPLWLADKKKKSERLVALTGSLPNAAALSGSPVEAREPSSGPSRQDAGALGPAPGPSLLEKLDGLVANA
jgi:hypothetical protein